MEGIGKLIVYIWLGYAIFIFFRDVVLESLQEWLSSSRQRALHLSRPQESALTWQMVRVAGVSYSNSDGVSRQDCIRQWSPGDKVWLERDLNNIHDANAVRVMTEHGQLGFLPRGLSARLTDTDLTLVRIKGASKGAASNGLLGCSIQLAIPSDHISLGDTNNAFTGPTQGKTPSVASFKKEAALEAARSGKLNHMQLIGILDRARDLDLTLEDCAVFEAAIARSAPPKVKVSDSKRSDTSSSDRSGGYYDSLCPRCHGAQEIYDADNDRHSVCSHCGGSGY
jgi:hypothetical protein